MFQLHVFFLNNLLNFLSKFPKLHLLTIFFICWLLWLLHLYRHNFPYHCTLPFLLFLFILLFPFSPPELLLLFQLHLCLLQLPFHILQPLLISLPLFYSPFAMSPLCLYFQNFLTRGSSMNFYLCLAIGFLKIFLLNLYCTNLLVTFDVFFASYGAAASRSTFRESRAMLTSSLNLDDL